MNDWALDYHILLLVLVQIYSPIWRNYFTDDCDQSNLPFLISLPPIHSYKLSVPAPSSCTQTQITLVLILYFYSVVIQYKWARDGDGAIDTKQGDRAFRWSHWWEPVHGGYPLYPCRSQCVTGPRFPVPLHPHQESCPSVDWDLGRCCWP